METISLRSTERIACAPCRVMKPFLYRDLRASRFSKHPRRVGRLACLDWGLICPLCALEDRARRGPALAHGLPRFPPKPRACCVTIAGQAPSRWVGDGCFGANGTGHGLILHHLAIKTSCTPETGVSSGDRIPLPAPDFRTDTVSIFAVPLPIPRYQGTPPVGELSDHCLVVKYIEGVAALSACTDCVLCSTQTGGVRGRRGSQTVLVLALAVEKRCCQLEHEDWMVLLTYPQSQAKLHPAHWEQVQVSDCAQTEADCSGAGQRTCTAAAA